MSAVPKSSFEFLKLLKKNNNRDWFAVNKDRYLKELSFLEDFAGSLLRELNKHDVIETPSGKKSLHRIYRDVRFSKDKTPYNTHWGGGFKRATRARRGSYYFHLEPGNTFIAGGFWGPNTDDMKRLRDEFAFDPTPLRKILNNQKIKDSFGALQGEQLKTVPRGYSGDDPARDLLRYKQFLLIKHFSDREVLQADFAKVLSKHFGYMRPFLDYMSLALTTDTNGESLVR